AGPLRHAHLGEDLVGTSGQVVHAVVAVQIVELDLALASGRAQYDAGAEREERGRGVGRGDREAARASRGDPAHLAVLLHAERDGLAPFERLIVVVAARVEAQVAAE